MSDIIFKIVNFVVGVILNCGIFYVILCFVFWDFLNPSIGAWRIILIISVFVETERLLDKKIKEKKRQ